METKLWGHLHEREDGTYRVVRLGSLASSDASWNWRVTDLYTHSASPASESTATQARVASQPVGGDAS